MKEALKNSKTKLKKSLESNKNECMIYPNLWNPVKAAQGGKFRALSTYIKKSERSKKMTY